MDRRLADAIANLRRALIQEGGEMWRSIVDRGHDANPPWPSELPSTPALRVWYAWEKEGWTDSSGDSWRHLEWAKETYARGAAASPPLAPSLVPVFENYALDTKDDSIWLYDPSFGSSEGVEGVAGLAALLDRVADGYFARRHSPFRRLRIHCDDDDDDDGELLERLPDSIDDLAVGTTVTHEYRKNGRPLGSLAVKRGPDEWLEALYIPDSAFDRFDVLRRKLADGTVFPQTNEGLVRMIERQQKRGTDSHIILGTARVWEPPSLSSLLERVHDAGWLEYDAEVMEGGYTFMRPARVREVSESLLTLARERFGHAYWDPSFVPFLENEDGEIYYFDVAGIDGPAGAVLVLSPERPQEREVRFASGADFLEWLVEDDLPEDVFSNGLMPWTAKLRLRPA